MTLCYVFPGSITPFNVWDLRWADWLQFAHAADEWAKKKASEGGGDV